MAQQMLLDRFAPACVMIDRKLQVLYVHGAVEDYLTFPAGELTTRVVDMAREGLRARLRGAIGKCLEINRPVSVTARVRRGEKSVPVKATVSPAAVSPGGRRPAADHLRGLSRLGREVAAAGRGGERRPSTAGRTEGHPRGASEHHRATGELQRPAQGLQRGSHGGERRTAIRQRGAGDLEGGAPVPQRGAQHHQRPPSGEGGRTGRHQQRHREPAVQHQHCHRVPGQGAQGQALHAGQHAPLQPDPLRRGQAHCGRPPPGSATKRCWTTRAGCWRT